jgi:inhibitor of KinA sporulation pathway (predicted exonuclease)
MYFRYRYGKTELAVLADRRLTPNDKIGLRRPEGLQKPSNRHGLAFAATHRRALPDALTERYPWQHPDLSKRAI